MKKLITLLLSAIIIICMISGCTAQPENNSNESKAQQSSDNVVSVPEATIDVTKDKLYIRFISKNEEGKSGSEIILAIDQVNEDTYVIYHADAPLKAAEIVYK